MPDEIQVGLARPVSVTEMGRVLQQYLPRIHEAHDATDVLRQRLQNGRRSIEDAKAGRIQGLNPDAIEKAEAQMVQLEQEFRQHDSWLTIGLGLTLAWGIGDVVHEAGLEEGWKPPPGSMLRLVLPGLVNVAVDLTQ